MVVDMANLFSVGGEMKTRRTEVVVKFTALYGGGHPKKPRTGISGCGYVPRRGRLQFGMNKQRKTPPADTLGALLRSFIGIYS
jgi:hypothetical protein